MMESSEDTATFCPWQVPSTMPQSVYLGLCRPGRIDFAFAIKAFTPAISRTSLAWATPSRRAMSFISHFVD